jgi:hypothetical protein
MKNYKVMEGVQEYGSNRPVELITGKDFREQHGTDYLDDEEKKLIESIQPDDLIICATNEGGFNCTEVNLTQVMEWLKANDKQ